MLGASACVELQKYDEAVRWCDDGLVVSFNCEVFLVIRMSSDVPSRGFIMFLCRRSVGFFSQAFLVFLMKESKKRRQKQPGKIDG